MLAGLRGDVSVKEVCVPAAPDRGVAHYQWREKLLEGGREALTGKQKRQGERELRKRIGQLERALGRRADRQGP